MSSKGGRGSTDKADKKAKKSAHRPIGSLSGVPENSSFRESARSSGTTQGIASQETPQHASQNRPAVKPQPATTTPRNTKGQRSSSTGPQSNSSPSGVQEDVQFNINLSPQTVNEELGGSLIDQSRTHNPDGTVAYINPVDFGAMSPGQIAHQAMSPHLQAGPISSASLVARIEELRALHRDKNYDATSPRNAGAGRNSAGGPGRRSSGTQGSGRGSVNASPVKRGMKRISTGLGDSTTTSVASTNAGLHPSPDASTSSMSSGSTGAGGGSTGTGSSEGGGTKLNGIEDSTDIVIYSSQTRGDLLGDSPSGKQMVEDNHFPVVDPNSVLDPQTGQRLRRINSREFQDLVDANMALVNWDEEENATMGIRIAIYTLTGSIVGAGAVSCPFAFQFMGSLAGAFLLCSMGFLSGYSGYLLGIAARKTGLSSYESIAIHTMGEKVGKFLALSSVIGVTCCATVAYTNLWGDTLLPILSTCSNLSESECMKGSDTMAIYSIRSLLLMVLTLCSFPLCIKRQMSGVALASFISIVAMGVLTLVIVYYMIDRMFQSEEEWKSVNNKYEWLGPNPFTDEKNHPCYGIFSSSSNHWGESSTYINPSGLLMGIPYFCSAFLCHFNVFSVFAEMKNPTKRRLKKVMRRTMYISGGLYGVIATSGFLVGISYENYLYQRVAVADEVSASVSSSSDSTFMSQASESGSTSGMAGISGSTIGSTNDIFTGTGKESAMCQQGVQGNILLNFPNSSIIVNIGRFCLFAALFGTYPLLVNPCRASLHRSIFGDDHRANNVQHWIETVGIMAFALSIAVLIPQVQVILGYAGSTFGILLAFVFPCIFVLRLSTEDSWTSKRLITMAILIGGVFLCVGTTTLQTINATEMVLGMNVPLTGNVESSKKSSHDETLLSASYGPFYFYHLYRAVDATGKPYKRKGPVGQDCNFETREGPMSGLVKAAKYAALKDEYEKTGERPPPKDKVLTVQEASAQGCIVSNSTEIIVSPPSNFLDELVIQ